MDELLKEWAVIHGKEKKPLKKRKQYVTKH